MGRKCVVPYCKSGYKSCTDKISLFNAPKDPILLSKWDDAIQRSDRAITSQDSVCAKHFSDADIIKHWTAEKNGEIVMKVLLGRCRLAPHAVPTIFPPAPTHISKTRRIHIREKERLLVPLRSAEEAGATLMKPNATVPIRVVNVRSLSEERLSLRSTEEVGDTLMKPNAAVPIRVANVRSLSEERLPLRSTGEVGATLMKPNAPVPIRVVNVSSLSHLLAPSQTWVVSRQIPAPARENFSFQDVWANARLLALPGETWGVNTSNTEELKFVAFSEMTRNEDGKIVATKQLCLDGSLRYDVYVLGKAVTEPHFEMTTEICGFMDISNILLDLHQRSICCGGPDEKVYRDTCISPENAYVDELGTWRHKRCQLLVKNFKRKCDACKNLKNSLRLHALRRKRKYYFKAY